MFAKMDSSAEAGRGIRLVSTARLMNRKPLVGIVKRVFCPLIDTTGPDGTAGGPERGSGKTRANCEPGDGGKKHGDPSERMTGC
ncbi:hypothetical protein [Alitabrizicola rongguiensis]|uniref:hypothetical protein n=1 Tax=Alitabrizicola rongguiensis TaxID=2909234 RepID=UPI001F4786E5|nr:hypothetical protein [Tabrizicola rongguiensis]